MASYEKGESLITPNGNSDSIYLNLKTQIKKCKGNWSFKWKIKLERPQFWV